MKTELTTKILIKRNSEAVFDYMADVENDVYWRSGVISMVQSTKGYTDLTSVQDEVLTLFGKTFKITAMVTKYVHNSGYAFRIFKGISGLTGYRKVQDVGENTLMTYSVSIETNPFIALLLQPLKFIFKKRFNRDLNRLRTILEKANEVSTEKSYFLSRPLQALQTMIFNLVNGTVFSTDGE